MQTIDVRKRTTRVRVRSNAPLHLVFGDAPAHPGGPVVHPSVTSASIRSADRWFAPIPIRPSDDGGGHDAA